MLARITESLDCCWRLFQLQPNLIRNGPAVAGQARAEAVGPLAAPDPPEEPAERELPAEQGQVRAQVRAQVRGQAAAPVGRPAPEQGPRPEPPVRALSTSIRRTTLRAPSFRHFHRQPPPISKSWRPWPKAPADSRSSTPMIFSVVCSASAKSKVNFIFWVMCPATRRKVRATR